MNLSIVGLGKLGTPMAAVYASRGHAVRGIDLNEHTVEMINARRSPIPEPGVWERLKGADITASTTYDAINETDITFIIVPTPSDAEGSFNDEYVFQAVEQIGKQLEKKESYHLVVVSSTVMPGACRRLSHELELSSLKTIGEDLGFCYSPEFIALGSVIDDMLNPDMILVGSSDQQAADKLGEFLSGVVENNPSVHYLTLEEAELAKISVNTYVTMKISYANHLAELCEFVPHTDAHKILAAVGDDTRIGRKYLKPGTAFGGPCFPRDNRAFMRASNDRNIPAWLAAATDSINERQIFRLWLLISNRFPEPCKVAILGLSYKPGTPVTEESAGVVLARRLLEEGYDVLAHDPTARLPGVDVRSTVAPLLDNVDIAVITTPHNEYKKILPHALQTNPDLVLIDCWDITPRGFWDETSVYRVGVG